MKLDAAVRNSCRNVSISDGVRGGASLTACMLLPDTVMVENGKVDFERCLCVGQAPAGEAQPSTEVDLFVSTEKIMILNTDLQVCYILFYTLMVSHCIYHRMFICVAQLF